MLLPSLGPYSYPALKSRNTVFPQPTAACSVYSQPALGSLRLDIRCKMNLSVLKRIVIGRLFLTRDDVHERLDKKRALAIFASDPISSNAYATEAIMSVLILMGSAALSLTLPIGLGIATLVLFVIFSYIQTILHYPDGGG